MDTSLTVFAAASHRMSWLSARHQVIAENIANADTPGFRAKDVRPVSFDDALKHVSELAPSRTNGTHLAGSKSHRPYRLASGVELYEAAPSGNGVTLEQEMLKGAQTLQHYDLTVSVMRSHGGMLRMALSR